MIDAEEIANIIGNYADPNVSKSFAYDVAKKKEFAELRLGPSEKVPDKPGQLLSHQIFMERFFSPYTPYTSALLFHVMGSGKTCTAAAVRENLKKIEVDGKPQKPAIIIVKNEDLGRSHSDEIAKVCTFEKYLPKPSAAEIKKGVEMTAAAKIARLNREVRKSYIIVTYEMFLKSLPPTDEAIRKQYSNRVIIIDEAHLMRIQPPKKKKAKGIQTSPIEKLEEEIDVAPDVESLNIDDPKVLYNKMKNFLHVIEGSRILLLTGTPIWDKVSEIASLLNLILPLDKQLPTGTEFDNKFFDKDGNLTPSAIVTLKTAFQGRVSFLRSMITTAERLEQGTKSPWLNYVTVYPDAMSEVQASYARKAKDTIETKIIKVKGKSVERETKGGTVLKLARDAMNMIIPTFNTKGEVIGAEYGPEAFEKYATKKIKRLNGNKTTVTNTYQITNPFLKDAIKNDLRTYATKFASIIEQVKNNPKEVVFIYNENVTGPGGAIMLALCMQLHGFIWVTSSTEISQLSPKRRFAVITSDSQTTSLPKQIQALLKSANREDNRYGDRLQVIIGSEKISVGISIKNVRQIHIVMPHWNIPAIEQATYRGFRFGGHEALPPEERKIKIFRHVAVEQDYGDGDEKYQTFEQGFPSNTYFSPKETTDIYIYSIAERKEYRNTQIVRILKETAFDCAINYERNVLPTDIDGTRDCDYKSCNYQCDGFPLDKKAKKSKVWNYSIPEDSLDYSTYNLYYASGRIKEFMDAIIDTFHSYFSLHIDLLISLLGLSPENEERERNLVLQAIDNLINGRVLIRDRYGFGCYLKEDGNIIFLDSNITSSSNYAESTYVEMPLVTDGISMDEFVDSLELKADKPFMMEFCNNPSQELLDKISYKMKIIMMEAAYVQEAKGQKIEAPQAEAMKMLNDILEENIHKVSGGMIVHILYGEEFKGVAYDVASKDIKSNGLMRWYDPKENKWKYINNIEKEDEYIEEIKDSLTEQKQIGFEGNEYGVYGWISEKDKQFRINVKRAGKGKTRGKVCSTFQKTELIDIFINNLGFLPDPDPSSYNKSKPDLINMIKGRLNFTEDKDILSDKTEDQLRGLLKLYTMDLNQICDVLMTWFDEHDLLYRIA